MKADLKQVYPEVWHLIVDGEAIANISHGARNEKILNIRVNPYFMNHRSDWRIVKTETSRGEAYVQLARE